MSPSPDHVLLIGEMGAGKTTTGLALAERLAAPFLDSDANLEARTGETGSAIAAKDGVERLHELELDTFLDMVRHAQRAVIAPAASVIDTAAGRKAISRHFVVWLDADDDLLVERQRRGSHRRLVHAVEREGLRERRRRHYSELSDIRIDTGELTVDESVMAILEAIDESARPSDG